MLGCQEDGVTGPNDMIVWLKHGQVNGKRHETATLKQLEAIVVIYRGITKFEIVFEDQKTPQMFGFKNWARFALASVNDVSSWALAKA